ncbi:UNVERIFIED_CONTAM: ispE [Trichonephila clavipes]
MKSFCVKAPAKINLFLHVVNKKETGYHLIEGLFVFANLSNFLEIKVGEKDSRYDNSTVEFINSESRINNQYNTITKAVDLLLRQAPVRTKVSIRVVKNIPIAAGLGSGSSDAGAVVRTLGKLWEIDRTILNEIALNVGADVPASVDSKPVFVRGIGEELCYVQKFSLPTNVVLVKPKKRFLSTPEVFSKHEGEFSESIKWSDDAEKDLLKLLKETRNDLQEIAISLVPEIKDVISTLESQEGSILSRMSGSGVSCFGIFDSEENAKAAAVNIREKQPEWWPYSMIEMFTQAFFINSLVAVVVISLVTGALGSFMIWQRWRYWLMISINQDLAVVEKINVNFVRLEFLITLAIFIAIAAQLIGILLIAAFLLIPAASARLISKTPMQMIIVATVFSVISGISGLMLSARKTEESDDVAGDVHNIAQGDSESLDTHVQSNENDII